MGDLKNALEQFKGRSVDIYTKHKLFGNQHIHMDYFIPETHLGKGFIARGQKIFITDSQIVNYNIKKYKVIINGNDFCIKIVQNT